MKNFIKTYWSVLIPFIAIIIIAFTWWANGAELEDAWLYAFSIIIVLISAWDSYKKIKENSKNR